MVLEKQSAKGASTGVLMGSQAAFNLDKQ